MRKEKTCVRLKFLRISERNPDTGRRTDQRYGSRHQYAHWWRDPAPGVHVRRERLKPDADFLDGLNGCHPNLINRMAAVVWWNPDNGMHAIERPAASRTKVGVSLF
jgi:hypothetical protein